MTKHALIDMCIHITLAHHLQSQISWKSTQTRLVLKDQSYSQRHNPSAMIYVYEEYKHMQMLFSIASKQVTCASGKPSSGVIHSFYSLHYFLSSRHLSNT